MAFSEFSSPSDFRGCDYCGTRSKPSPSICGGCRLVMYCNVSCQRAARKAHKAVCIPASAGRVAALRQEADAGNVLSMDSLGLCYLHGAGTPVQIAEAVRWFRAAGDLPTAQLSLGWLLSTGRAGARDEPGGAALIHAAALAGLPAAQCNYAIILLRGIGVAVSAAESFRWASLAAEAGVPEAWQHLGVAFATGCGVRRDRVKGLRWLSACADVGRVDVLLTIAAIYDEGGGGVARDAVKALAWKRRAADAGLPEGIASLGEALAQGLGAAVDAVAAARLYQAAAEAGVPRAATNLGVACEKGVGVPKDTTEALRWFRIAAEAGTSGGLYNLGRCYDSGIGVPKDLSEALSYYRRAAEPRSAEWNTPGMPPEPQSAAATESQFILGVCYLNGEGVDADVKEARRWLDLAAAAGHSRARSALSRIILAEATQN